jgi:hypothetical protein
MEENKVALGDEKEGALGDEKEGDEEKKSASAGAKKGKKPAPVINFAKLSVALNDVKRDWIYDAEGKVVKRWFCGAVSKAQEEEKKASPPCFIPVMTTSNNIESFHWNSLKLPLGGTSRPQFTLLNFLPELEKIIRVCHCVVLSGKSLSFVCCQAESSRGVNNSETNFSSTYAIQPDEWKAVSALQRDRPNGFQVCTLLLRFLYILH